MITTALIFLLVAGSLVAMIVLTRQWALDERGVDLDSESMDLHKVKHFSARQKMILAGLLVPAILVLVIAAVYVLASVVITAIGVPVAPA